MDIGFALNYTNLYLINVTPEAEKPTWARLGQGISSAKPNDSDETSEDYYYDGDGGSDSAVTGGSHGYDFSGHRYYGNRAQDFIAGLKFKTGAARITDFMHIGPDGRTISGKATVKDIVDNGGDANSKGEFSCSIMYNGAPKVEPAKGHQFPSTISASPLSLTAKKTEPLVVTVQPETASKAVAFASSAPDKVTVDDFGNVTAVAQGKATISMKSVALPTVTATVDVTVTA